MKDRTRLVHSGRPTGGSYRPVNQPVFRASTILFPTMADLEVARKGDFRTVRYGLLGTPSTFALEDAINALEESHGAVIVSSGLAAIATAMLAVLAPGDHILVADSVYAPTRRVCETLLARNRIETTYYDPLIGGGIAALMRPNTRVVFVESPGSLTFEVQDVPAIVAAAHARGALVAMDNTWASPLFFKPLRHGVDISINAATKYIVGHADVLMGTIATTQACYARVKETAITLGNVSGADDVYLALRGLRTMAVRMRENAANAMAIATWLQSRPEVERVLYPALSDDPGHGLWKRDFTGASGLFGVILRPCPRAAVEAMIDGLSLFGIGGSWGGYESLVLVTDIAPLRTATKWPARGATLRIHAGIEDPGDLVADLEQGFARLHAAVQTTTG